MHKIIVKVADFVFVAVAVIVIIGAATAGNLLYGLVVFVGSCVALSMWSLFRCILNELVKINQRAERQQGPVNF